VSLEEFIRSIFDTVERSALCELATIISYDETTVKIRELLYADAHIDVYFNERNGTVAYALIEQGMRIYGADNAGAGWHVHPFDDPDSHLRLSEPMEFSKFLAAVAQQY
jgi:hypothetical protein